MRFLMKMLPQAPSGLLYKALRTKLVKVNGRPAKPDQVLQAGDVLQFYFPDERLASLGYHAAGKAVRSEAAMDDFPEIPVVYEDDYLVVFNKPAGILSQKDQSAGRSLSEYAADYVARGSEAASFRAGLCNRLDRGTSGIVLCGKNLRMQQALNESIRHKDCRKYYLAIVTGVSSWKGVRYLVHHWRKNRADNKVSLELISCGSEMPAQIPADVACCSARVIQTDAKAGLSLLMLELISGKSHQLRAQLASEGIPILGDRKYGPGANNGARAAHQMLHAYRYQLPEDTEAFRPLASRSFTAQPPTDMTRLLDRHFPGWQQKIN
ncbi:MAG: RluA family pseudouridine synthase [Firmicutes bacterium]|nr:RluA family pseudouridine synthase [Bacillota bacterium]